MSQGSRGSSSRPRGDSGGRPKRNNGGSSRGGTPRRSPGGSSGVARGSASRGSGASKPPAVSLFDEELLTDVLALDVLPSEVVVELEPFPDRVRAYISAAVVLLEDDPAEALRYAQEAKKMASRSAAVREAVGITAYHAGQFDLAARELRAAARISGSDALVPLIADCERGLGRPEKALELAMRPTTLDRDGRVELRIVAAGARLDLGQPEEALVMLQGPLLTSDEVSGASSRLKYAYAEALLACGRTDEARQWFLKTAEVDPEAETDAVERAQQVDAAGESGPDEQPSETATAEELTRDDS